MPNTQATSSPNLSIRKSKNAATLYKGLSTSMAGQFTSAAAIDYRPKIHEDLHTTSSEDIKANKEGENTKEEEKLGPREGHLGWVCTAT